MLSSILIADPPAGPDGTIPNLTRMAYRYETHFQRKKKKDRLTCLVLLSIPVVAILLMWIGQEIYSFYDDRYVRPFENRFSEYTARKWDSEKVEGPACIGGKVMTIKQVDENPPRLVDWFRALPEELIPSDSIEVSTLVYMKCHLQVVGTYSSGNDKTSARAEFCSVSVVDLKSRRVVARQLINAEYYGLLPATICGHCSAPLIKLTGDKIASFLTALPRCS